MSDPASRTSTVAAAAGLKTGDQVPGALCLVPGAWCFVNLAAGLRLSNADHYAGGTASCACNVHQPHKSCLSYGAKPSMGFYLGPINMN